MKIITLVDNITYKQGLKGEHGVSFLVKTPDLHILFDAGQTNQFIHNAHVLGEDLTQVDYLIVSHGHYDHTGGIADFLEMNNKAILLIKPQAFEEKSSTSTGSFRPIGMPHNLEKYSGRIRFITDVFDLSSTIKVLGHLPFQTTYEKVSSKLYINSGNKMIPDTFEDELILYLVHNGELIVVSGCAHRGIINILKAVKQHSGVSSYRLITGGMHLNGAPRHQLEATTHALQNMKIEQLMPNHCTGIEAYQYFKQQLSCHVSYASTGTVVTV